MACRRWKRSFGALEATTALLVWITLDHTNGAIYDLYNTKIATSDLRWTKEPRNSWEELSGFDRLHNVIRSYQICRPSGRKNNNWLRSPFINTRGALRVNVEIEFSIAKCNWPGADSEYCRQTFNLFYYESDRDVASSTFPPWQERPYVKIDTVAANSNNDINKKTFTIEPLHGSRGIYIAAQDQGACMSLISLKLYYYFCPETIHSLANFAETMTGSKSASLVTVPGTCVTNAVATEDAAPKFYCGSTGEWQIITGNCKCAAGYHPNTAVTACHSCAAGTFKATAGNGKCVQCPANSGAFGGDASTAAGEDSVTTPASISTEGMSVCPCHPGFARAKHENLDQPCTRIPSVPTLVKVETNATTALILWQKPQDLGGRSDLYYRFSCVACAIDDEDSCGVCPEEVAYRVRPGKQQHNLVSLSSIAKFYKEQIEVVRLEPFTRYVIKIYARNGVSDAVPAAETSYVIAELATKESVPPPVDSIYIADTSPNSVVVNWHAPYHPRGRISGYEIEVTQRNAGVGELGAGDEGVTKPFVIETVKTACPLEELESNTEYEVRIRAETSMGFGKYSASVVFKTSERNGVKMDETKDDNDSGLPIATVSAVLVVVVGCLALFFYYRRQKAAATRLSKKSAESDETFAKLNPAAVARYNEVAERAATAHRRRSATPESSLRTAYVDYPDPRRAVQRMDKEINLSNLRLCNVIGRGEFAVVYKATMVKGGHMKTVAAKQLKDGASAKDQSNFLREACTMAQFDHPNILKLIGVVTKDKPEMIISEHVENGSLCQFLKRHRGRLAMTQFLQMLRGIASGMRYLSDMQFVHRDLAARNILVDSDTVCKVSDFGLSRTLDKDPHATYTTRGGKIPLRWTAPESIRFREFTSASDVWSYGIVMWEVMSYGEKPYWDMTNEDVMRSIGSGMRLPAPTGCPKALHELMLECWSLGPAKRPAFDRIVSDFNRFIRRSSLLRVRQEDEMERTVCCSPNVRDAIFVDQTGESFLGEPDTARPDADYPQSESSSLSQEDTCSSLLAADERCLNV